MSTRAALMFVGASWALMGCGIPAPKGPVPPGMDRDEYSMLQIYAARNLNCERENLTYETFGKDRHLFKGCDDRMEMLLLTGSDARGYSRGFIVPSPANVYAKERKCDIRQTTVERVDHQTRIVDGCGVRTTYLMACGYSGCTWIANTESKR